MTYDLIFFMFLIMILLKIKKYRPNYLSPLRGIKIFLCPDQKEINVNHTFKSIFPSFENDKFIVGIIWDSNLKDKIKVGDEILKINVIEFNKLTKCQIMRMSFDDFKGNNNLKVELKDKETNEIKIVDIQN